MFPVYVRYHQIERENTDHFLAAQAVTQSCGMSTEYVKGGDKEEETGDEKETLYSVEIDEV